MHHTGGSATVSWSVVIALASSGAACGARSALLDAHGVPSEGGTEVADATADALRPFDASTDGPMDASSEALASSDSGAGLDSDTTSDTASGDAPGDAIAMCTNECEAGSSTCEPGAILTCAIDDGGCLAWGSPMSCGASGTCVAGDAGEPECVALAAPRPIAPLSTSNVTSHAPVFRWALAAGESGAQVDICQDRACSNVVSTFSAGGTTGAPSTPLVQGVYYWRLRGTAGGNVGTATSVVWEFVVGARSAPVNTSWGMMTDVNGDGFADTIIGEPDVNVDLVNLAGDLQLYLGGPGGISNMPTTLEAPLTGDFPELGNSVSSAGDVNGDGFGDVIAGAPDGSGEFPGNAYIFLGSAGGVEATPIQLAAPGAAPGPGSYFAWSVSGAGDVNGDGYADVLVLSLGSSASNAYLYFGGPSGPTTPPTTFGTRVSALAGAGDVNGDGFGDIVVGDPGANDNAGSATVLLGSPNGLSSSLPLVGPTAGYAWFGYTVTCAGDVNGDGFADVLVGAPGLAPAAYVFLGGAGGPSLPEPTLNNPSGVVGGLTSPVEYNFAGSISTAADVNDDGFGDVVVGAGSANESYIYFGSAAGVATTPSAVQSTGASMGFGHDVAGGGDVNGDGFDDIVVGPSPEQLFLGGSDGGLTVSPVALVDGPAAL